MDNDNGTNVIRVKLMKQKKYGLGFLVRRRSKSPHVVVSDLVSNGTAAESGLVQIGDIVLKVNDTDFRELPYEKSLEVLKALPVNVPVVLILKGPEGYTSHLETRFAPDGTPRTIRVTKPVLQANSLIGRIRKTFSATSPSRGCRTKQTQINCECHNSIGEHALQTSSENKDDSTSGSRSSIQTLSSNEPQKLDKNSRPKNNNAECALNNSALNNNSLKTTGAADRSLGVCDQGCKGGSSTEAKSKALIKTEPKDETNHGCINGGGTECTGYETKHSTDNKRQSNISDDISVFIDEDQSLSATENAIVIQTETHHLVNTNMEQRNELILNGGPGVNVKRGHGHECNHVNGTLTSGEEGNHARSRSPSVDVKGRKKLDVEALEKAASSSGKNSPVKKFVKLRNVAEERAVCTDTLHLKSIEVSYTYLYM